MRWRQGIAVALAIVGIAGCGSALLSPAAYRAKVDGLCARAEVAITARPTGTLRRYAGFKQVATKALGVLATIEKIDPPLPLAIKADAWLSSLRREGDDLQSAVNAFKAHDLAAATRSLKAAEATGPKLHAGARALGVPACATGTG